MRDEFHTPLDLTSLQMVNTTQVSASDPVPAPAPAALTAWDDAQCLAAIINSADDAIVSKCINGVIMSWNPAAQALFGYAAGEAIGQHITMLLPPERLQEEANILARLHCGDRVQHFETVRRCKDGRLIDVSVSISPVRDASGRIIGASKVARDITELVATRLREQRLRSFLSALMHVKRATTQIDDSTALLNELCAICLEFGHAEVACVLMREGGTLRLAASRGLPAGTEEALLQAVSSHPLIARAMVEGAPVILRDTADQTLGSQEEPASPLNLQSWVALPLKRENQTAGVLVMQSTPGDLFSEQALEALTQTVAEFSTGLDHLARDRQFKGIVEAAMDAIVVVDAAHRISLFNPAAEFMFHWPAVEALGQPIERLIPDRFGAVHAQHMASFAASDSQPRRMGGARSLSARRSDGTEFPIEATVSRFGSGHDLRMMVVIRDVSELREAELAQRAQAAAEAANDAKGEFISRMSHELRTPLNAVIGFSRLLLDDAHHQVTAMQHTQVGHINSAGQHMLALVNDMLDLVGIESGRCRVEQLAVPLAAALQQATNLVAPNAERAGVSLFAPSADELLPAVLADPNRLRQVLTNLMSNAIKYNKPGGSVTLEVSTHATEVKICVADTGIGMTPQQQAELFQPFNRLGREHSGIEGTGIGLVVTRQLVELMQGRLTMDSEPGQGTRACLVLPLAAGVAAAQTPEPDTEQLEAADPRGVVLSVEDNPINQILLEQMLEIWPHVTLLQAEDGTSGLAMARAGHPDVILLDMHLPDMGGLEFLAQLRSDPATQALPVVVLSASAMPQDVAQVMEQGVVDYLTKPLDRLPFLRRVLSLLSPQAQ
jgi:PAS domain S-box-containing protein